MARRLGEPQAVLLRAGLGALVRADESRAVVGDPHPAQERAARAADAVGPLELLLQRPQRRVAIRGEDSLQRPFLQGLCGVLVGIAALGGSWQVDLDHVERGAREQLCTSPVVDHVIGGAMTSASDGTAARL